MIVFSILLWIFSDQLAGAIAGKSEESTEIKALDYVKIHYIAFSFVGVLILCGAIPSFVSSIYQNAAMLKGGFITKDSMNYISNFSGMMQYAFRLIIGLCLTLGSKGIVRALHKFRNAGIIEADEKQDL